MNDDQEQKRDAQDRVFEFTPDMNIAPVKNTDATPATPNQNAANNSNRSPLQEAVERLNISPNIRSQISQISSTPGPAPTPSPASTAASPVTPPKMQFGNSLDARGINTQSNPPPVTPKANPAPNNQAPAEARPLSALAHDLNTEKAIRTYESDVAEILAKKKVSVATIAIAENEKRQKNKEPVPAPAPMPAAKIQPPSTPVPAPVPKVKEPEPVIEKKPELPPEPKIETPAPVIELRPSTEVPTSPPPAPKPVPPPAPKPQFAFETLPVRQRSGSIRVIEGKPAKTTNWKRLYYLLLSMIFILGGIIAAYYLYIQSPLVQLPANSQPAVTIDGHNALIAVDKQVMIQTDNIRKEQLRDKILAYTNSKSENNTVTEIILTKNINGSQTAVTAQDAISLLDIDVPNTIIRSMEGNWLLGVFTDSFGQNNIFVVLKHTFFQNVFAGMLAWEDTILRDLGKIGIFSAEDVSNNQSRQFIDALIKNRDVRDLRSREGKTLIMYSFINNNLLAISNNSSTMSEIISRLERQAYVR